jgi:predicted nucleic acid-binding protein
MIVISDSSPAISLAVIKKLHLFEDLYHQVVIPEAVFNEITFHDKPFSKDLNIYFKNKIKKVTNDMAVEMLLSDIGKGEAEAIVLAKELKADFIIVDDLKARKLALINGLEVRGTLGILLEAKKKGFIENIKPLIKMLVDNGIRINEKIIRMTLEAAGE